MFWPRLVLTKEESTKVSKYFDPDKRRRVMRRIYTGFLSLDSVNRQPSFPFQIARRCRVFGITASGDLPQFRIQIQDSSGEQYFPDAVAASNVFGGYNQLPTSSFYPAFAGSSLGLPFTLAPFVFEPNIVLEPNQVLNLIGAPMGPYESKSYYMEICFHVWEFPGYTGGP